MSDAEPRDVWHEQLLESIRERAERNQNNLSPIPTASTPSYNWPEVSSRLSRAAAVAVPRATVSAGRRYGFLRRALILRFRRVIVALLRFLTARQGEFNLGVLFAVHETGKAVQSLEQRLLARDEEIRQLRDRVLHLEKHLPVEAVRQAS